MAQSTACTTYNYFPLVVVVALFTPIVDNMAFYRNVFSFIVIFAALPNMTSVLPQLYCILRSWMPSAADLIQELVSQIHKYCKERIFEDIQQQIARIIDLVKSLYALVHFVLQNVFAGITDTGLLLHNNGMGHTDEILQQVLGYDGAALPGHVGTTINKLLSLILFLFWTIMGLLCISRLSYNKFFLLMSSTFLIHAFLGPVWCIRRLAFCIEILLRLGSLISGKPIPVAISVVVAFTLKGFRKWRKNIAIASNTEDMLKLNETLEKRLAIIEKKLDVLLLKIGSICYAQSNLATERT